ncbi:hypothetical protein B0H17DRAFT_1045458 [Mycena rosella]|uniref:F-box domain-containing protein n=1 Tax=Mycena rosella TaxID=1033263 RepID=A0AAD7GQI4_MYCRO|nr:hypothetical protein B0H17DRAFT_1045458 [Mycena rosella]
MSSHDSPFADKFGTNYVPSDLEMDQLRALLVEPIAELALVDAQIDELDVLVRQLKGKRASLQTRIDVHAALMSPFRRIPQDVLGEIFSACLPTMHNALIDPGEAPMLLGRICRHWRDVAYSTPRLWSSLHIPPVTGRFEQLDSHDPPNIDDRLEKFVEAWLDRSASCPLSISISRGPYDSDIGPSGTTPGTIRQLIRVAGRLCHLSICTHLSEIRPLLLFGREDLPCLRSIHIQAPSDPNELLDGVPILQIPNLHQISLHASTDALTLPLRWSELTDLSLECFPIWVDNSAHNSPNPGGLDQNGAQDLLRRCPNLVRCHLQATTYAPFIGGSTVIVPHLKALSLSDEFDSAQFMQSLDLPSLRYLGIGGGGPGTPSLRSIQSSMHGLTLELRNSCRLPEDGLVDLLNLLRGVSRVRLPRTTRIRLPNHLAMVISLDDEFLARLSPKPTHTVSPALTHIEFGICDFSDIALLDFIRARMATGNPLRRIEAILPRAMDIDIPSELHPFISTGLQVDLKYEFRTWDLDVRDGLSEMGCF